MKKEFTWLILSIVAYLYVCVLTFQICRNYILYFMELDIRGIIENLFPFIWNMTYCKIGFYSSSTLGKKMLNKIING